MFSSDLSLTDATPTTYVYSQISLENSKSVRADSVRGLNNPRTLVISHTTSGTGNKITDRHLVRLNDVQLDTIGDVSLPQSGSVYMVIEKPRRVITAANIQSMVDQLKGFATAANITKLLNGEP